VKYDLRDYWEKHSSDHAFLPYLHYRDARKYWCRGGNYATKRTFRLANAPARDVPRPTVSVMKVFLTSGWFAFYRCRKSWKIANTATRRLTYEQEGEG